MNRSPLYKESFRLGTFNDCAEFATSPIALAKAGFYHNSCNTREDAITCPWCKIRKGLRDIHRKEDLGSIHHPNCTFLSGTSGNVPIPVPGQEEEREIKLALTNLSSSLVAERYASQPSSVDLSTGTVGLGVHDTQNCDERQRNGSNVELEESVIREIEVSLSGRISADFQGAHPQAEIRQASNVEVCLMTREITLHASYREFYCTDSTS